jgi:hypothetical protein
MVVRCIPLDEIVAGLQAGVLGQAMHVASLLLALRLQGQRRRTSGE